MRLYFRKYYSPSLAGRLNSCMLQQISQEKVNAIVYKKEMQQIKEPTFSSIIRLIFKVFKLRIDCKYSFVKRRNDSRSKRSKFRWFISFPPSPLFLHNCSNKFIADRSNWNEIINFIHRLNPLESREYMICERILYYSVFAA